MKKVVLLILATVMLMTVVFGCSSQEEATAPAPAPDKPAEVEAPAAAEAPSEEKESNRLDYVRYVLPRSIEALDEADVWSAVYMGYFADEGIDLIVEMAISQNAIKMVAAGQGDICVPNPSQQFATRLSGVDLISIFQLNVNNIYGVAVKPDSGIKTWKDLEGKKIAVTSATSYTNLNPILIAAGVDPETVTLVPVADQRAAMLQSGEVDGSYTWQKEYQQWQAQGVDLEYLDGNEILKNCSNSVCATPEFLEENHDLVVRFCRAMAKGLYFVKCNPEAAAEIVTKRFPSLGLEAADAAPSMQGLINITNDENTEKIGYGYHDVDKWQLCYDWAVEMGQIEAGSDINISEMFTNDLIEEINDFDKAAIEADAKNFVLGSVEWLK